MQYTYTRKFRCKRRRETEGAAGTDQTLQWNSSSTAGRSARGGGSRLASRELSPAGLFVSDQTLERSAHSVAPPRPLLALRRLRPPRRPAVPPPPTSPLSAILVSAVVHTAEQRHTRAHNRAMWQGSGQASKTTPRPPAVAAGCSPSVLPSPPFSVKQHRLQIERDATRDTKTSRRSIVALAGGAWRLPRARVAVYAAHAATRKRANSGAFEAARRGEATR